MFLAGIALIAVLVREPIIDLIDDDRAREEMLRKLRKYIKRDWASSFANELADRLRGRELGNHVVADKVDITDGKSKIVLEVALVTKIEEGDAPRRTEVTPKSLDQAIKRRLEDVERGRN